MNHPTALLVMDMQTVMLSILPDATVLVSNVAKAIAHARNKKIPVIYVTVAFRPGGSDINLDNKVFSTIGGRDPWTIEFAEEWVKIHPDLLPLADEFIVTKRRVSAFTGSDLEVLLRSQGIQHIILTGYATSGVVLSTVREASDKDYRITVLSDGCGDTDEEVHRVLTEKVFPRMADILTVGEWRDQQ